MANFARQPCRRVIASNCQQQKVLCCLLPPLTSNKAAQLAFIAQIPFLRNETTSLLSERVPKKITLQRETCMKCRKGRETLRAVAVLDAFPRPAVRPALINEPSSHSSLRLLSCPPLAPNISTCAIVSAILNSDMGHCFRRNDRMS